MRWAGRKGSRGRASKEGNGGGGGGARPGSAAMSLREGNAGGNRSPGMDTRGRPVYTEWSPWPGWITVVFWGSMVVAMSGVTAAGSGSAEDRLLGALVLGAVAVLVQWLVAGLRVRLYRDGLVVGIGSSGWISKRVPYQRVVRLESVQYQPLLEFGGWGIRWGKDGKKAWTARGNRAVVLHLDDGTRLYVSSDSPRRLEERIRAVAGTRIGPKPSGNAPGA